jgi:Flp pilus assembly pilin Flp
MMKQFTKRFLKDENGAVTVDWVVLTAAVVGMSAISFFVIEDNSNSLIESAASAVGDQDDFTTE